MPIGDLFEDQAKANTHNTFTNPLNFEVDKSTTTQIVDIYPNPFKDNITVDFFSEQSGNIKVDIYHISGQLLSESNFNVVEGINSIELDKGFNNVNGILQIVTTSVDGEVFIDKVIKLE